MSRCGQLGNGSWLIDQEQTVIFKVPPSPPVATVRVLFVLFLLHFLCVCVSPYISHITILLYNLKKETASAFWLWKLHLYLNKWLGSVSLVTAELCSQQQNSWCCPLPLSMLAHQHGHTGKCRIVLIKYCLFLHLLSPSIGPLSFLYLTPRNIHISLLNVRLIACPIATKRQKGHLVLHCFAFKNSLMPMHLIRPICL